MQGGTADKMLFVLDRKPLDSVKDFFYENSESSRRIFGERTKMRRKGESPESGTRRKQRRQK